MSQTPSKTADANIDWAFVENALVYAALFVFSIDDPKQNAGSLLTPVSSTVFDALSHGTLGFALHGSYFNHFLIGGNSLTAYQIVCFKWLLNHGEQNRGYHFKKHKKLY